MHTITCPYCAAKPGDPCTTRTGNRANRPHAARTNAAPATTGTDDRTEVEESTGPMTVRESSSGTWYVGGRWKVRLDGDDHATAVRDSTHVYRVVRELVMDTRVSRSIRNPGHILDLVDRARRTANAAGRDDSPAHPHKKGPPPAASGGGHISLRKETQP